MASNFDYKQLTKKNFNEFYLKSIIGQGAMGVVYRAKDTKLNRDVALKILKKEALNIDNSIIKRFKREAQNIARLKHANIIDVYSIGSYDGFNYIAMEYVDGKKLSDLLKHKLDFNYIINIMYLVCKAIQYSHKHGILHRDIKPANIMISNSGEIKIVDFGLSKSNNINTSKISQYGDVIGTPIYMSMEALENSEEATEKSDVYALGVVFYEMVTNSLPFMGKTSNELYKSILIGNYVEANKFNSEIPMEINNLINNMLKKEHRLRISLDSVISILKKYSEFTNEDLSLNDSFLSKNNTITDVENCPTLINKTNNNTSSISDQLYADYIKRETLLFKIIGAVTGVLALGYILYLVLT